MPESLSLAQARRIALAAQGFSDPRPRARPDIRHLRRVMDRVGMVQLDSVNVLVRSHYMTIFSRLGPYPMPALDRFTNGCREVFEYWGHAASLIPVARYPLFRHRMAGYRGWQRVQRMMEEHPGYLEDVLDEVRRRGPLIVSDLEDPGGRTGPWWGYSRGKVALEAHFGRGAVTVSARRNFARVYDLAERVLPGAVLSAPALPTEEAHRQMLLLAAQSLGVGTAADLADYYRIRVPLARPRLAELVEAGELQEVAVEGWTQPAYLYPDTRLPRRVRARALLSPFDSLIWERDRTERLFGFRYRIEIYVPGPDREYGYYVLPFLLGQDLVGRVDLKADRAAGVLLVQAAYAEDGHDRDRVAGELAEALLEMAGWLGLGGVIVRPRGNLVSELSAALPRA